MPPVKNPSVMTSYGGIIRIRLKGRSLITSSQPANTSSPVFISINIIYPFIQKCNRYKKNSYWRVQKTKCMNNSIRVMPVLFVKTKLCVHQN